MVRGDIRTHSTTVNIIMALGLKLPHTTLSLTSILGRFKYGGGNNDGMHTLTSIFHPIFLKEGTNRKRIDDQKKV